MLIIAAVASNKASGIIFENDCCWLRMVDVFNYIKNEWSKYTFNQMTEEGKMIWRNKETYTIINVASEFLKELQWDLKDGIQ